MDGLFLNLQLCKGFISNRHVVGIHNWRPPARAFGIGVSRKFRERIPFGISKRHWPVLDQLRKFMTLLMRWWNNCRSVLLDRKVERFQLGANQYGVDAAGLWYSQWLLISAQMRTTTPTLFLMEWSIPTMRWPIPFVDTGKGESACWQVHDLPICCVNAKTDRSVTRELGKPILDCLGLLGRSQQLSAVEQSSLVPVRRIYLDDLPEISVC